MAKNITLTGIKPTGIPHLGNYIGAIQPALQEMNCDCYFFIADYHAITTLKNKDLLKQYTYEVAASWLACGLDPDKVVFYKQSDIPELLELYWILMCSAPKGLLNRAHAYKYLIDKNNLNHKKPDEGINMGIFSYPVLMAADILLFQAKHVPVGKDQTQHIEIARDIAIKFNQEYKEFFCLPIAKVSNELDVPGIDGQKMSKSYDNTIPLFHNSKLQHKQIMKIKTDSKSIEDPKDFESCIIFKLYSQLADKDQISMLKQKYINGGVGYGEIKKSLALLIKDKFKIANNIYNDYINHPEKLDEILKKGALKARHQAQKNLHEIKKMIGII